MEVEKMLATGLIQVPRGEIKREEVAMA